MAKATDFAEKARKAVAEKGVKCAKCGTIKNPHSLCAGGAL